MQYTATALAAAAVLLALLGAAHGVPQLEAEEEEPSPTLEITVAALLPVGAARGGGGGGGAEEESRGRALALLAEALAARLAEAGGGTRGRQACAGNLTAAMAALLPPGAEGAGWESAGAAPPGWKRLVSRRLVRLAAPAPAARGFFDDVDLSYQSVLTLIVEMFASMVGLGWGAFSTFASG